MFYCFISRINAHTRILALACYFVSQSLFAQIVNIEDRRLNYDSAGWYGQLDLGGNYVQNNNRVLTLNGNLRLDRQTAAGNQLLFMGNYRIIQADGDNFLNAGFVHFRYGQELSDRLNWEAFSQLQYDEKLQLSLRWLLGTGPRWKMAEGRAGTAFLGVLYMYEYDELRNASVTFRDHRLSTYLSTKWKVNPSLTLNSTTYYQPRLLDFNRTRLSTSTVLNLQLSESISFNTRLDATYDARINDVFPDVPELTFNWRNGLRWRF